MFKTVMEEQVDEIQSRARRMETMLHKLRESLGVADGGQEHVEVLNKGEVKVAGFDVTLSQIKRALQKAEMYTPDEIVSIRVGDELIAEITFLE